MKQQILPELQILDCEIYSPYRSATIKSCTRIKAGLYLILTSLLDSFYVDKLYVKGENILYKLKKVIVDGQCKTSIEK